MNLIMSRKTERNLCRICEIINIISNSDSFS